MENYAGILCVKIAFNSLLSMQIRSMKVRQDVQNAIQVKFLYFIITIFRKFKNYKGEIEFIIYAKLNHSITSIQPMKN